MNNKYIDSPAYVSFTTGLKSKYVANYKKRHEKKRNTSRYDKETRRTMVFIWESLQTEGDNSITLGIPIILRCLQFNCNIRRRRYHMEMKPLITSQISNVESAILTLDVHEVFNLRKNTAITF